MSYPNELKYTKDHEWIKIEGNSGTIGITHFAQQELGDIIYVDLKKVGTVVKQHEIFGTVEAVKTVSDLFSPVSGKITAINELLTSDAGVVNTKPYSDGWMIKIELSNAAEVAELLTSEGYQAIIG